MVDAEALAGAMTQAVPFARTIGVRFDDIDTTQARLSLADDDRLHNHVGGPHAGVLFSLGETASGTVVMAAFGEHMARGIPLVARAEIAYRRVAMGDLHATARLGRPVDDVIAELDSGTRPEFPVHVELSTGQGDDAKVVAEMTVVWTLRPHRA